MSEQVQTTEDAHQSWCNMPVQSATNRDHRSLRYAAARCPPWPQRQAAERRPHTACTQQLHPLLTAALARLRHLEAPVATFVAKLLPAYAQRHQCLQLSPSLQRAQSCRRLSSCLHADKEGCSARIYLQTWVPLPMAVPSIEWCHQAMMMMFYTSDTSDNDHVRHVRLQAMMMSHSRLQWHD